MKKTPNQPVSQRSAAAREHARQHPRGFARLPAERRREIAGAGGKTAHRLGVAHRWSSEEAAAAGRKGGRMSRRPDHQGQGEAAI